MVSGQSIPRVAVITRTKDRLELLGRAIDSVLDQTFEDWVHIIVNDGGNRRDLDAFLARYAGSYAGRLRVVHNDAPSGMQNASNAGVSAAPSDYLLVHDDDDSLLPRFLEKTVGFLDEAEESTGAVVTQTTWVREEVLPDGTPETIEEEPYFPVETISLPDLAAGNRFPPIALLFRRSALEEIGEFNQEFDVLGDWDFNLRLLSKFDIAVLDEPLARYHWRLNAGAGGGGNTVVSGLAHHRAMGAKMRTHYLRRDLEEGSTGLGALLSNAHATGEGGFLDRRMREIFQQEPAAGEGSPQDQGHLGPALLRKPRTAGGFRPKLANYESLLEKVDVVSFDVFDTLLFRRVRQPVDVFRWLEREIHKASGGEAYPIFHWRVSAERVARQTAGARYGHTEIGLDEIYEAFAEISGLSAALVSDVRARELALEKRVCYINRDALQLLKKARKAGKKLIFVSDMYLGAREIAELVDSDLVPESDIYSSAEWGCSKAQGALYHKVLRSEGIKAGRVLHIGDNFYSDVVRATEAGIIGYHYNPQRKRVPLVDHARFETLYEGQGFVDSLVHGVTTERRQSLSLNPCPQKDPTTYWEQIGFEVVGPIALGFLSWLTARAEARGVKKLFFLARDGYLMERLFPRLKEAWNLDIEVEYVYASRRLLNFAAIDRWDQPTEEFLMTCYPNLRFKDFFERVGLVPEQYRDILASIGVKNPNRKATNKEGEFLNTAARKAVKNTFRTLSGTIITQAREEREKLLNYLDTLGFDPKEAGIIDLGWGASSLSALQRIFAPNKDTPSGLRGFYLGTLETALETTLEEGSIESWLLEYGKPALTRETLTACIELLEFFFCAPHPTIVGLDRDEERNWQPVYGEMELTQEHLGWVELIGQGATSLFGDMISLYPERHVGEGLRNYAGMALRRVLYYPTAEEGRVIGRLPHRVGFGGCSHVRPLAQKPGLVRRSLDWGALEAGFHAAFWKRGYIVQIPQASKFVAGVANGH